MPLDSIRQVFKTPDIGWGWLLLSHQLANWLGATRILLWVTSWTAYEPAEMAVINNFRKAHGEHRPLIDAPGFLLDTTLAEDAWALLELFHLILIFHWQGFALRDDQEQILWMADETIEAHSYSDKASNDLQTVFEDLGIALIE